MTRDPVAVLLPAMGALLVDVGCGVVLRAHWADPRLPWLVVALLAARPWLQAPFRAAMLRGGLGGAELRGGSAVRLAVIDAVRAALATVVTAAAALPFALGAAWLSARGLYLFAAIAVGVGVVIAVGLGTLARAALAYAPALIVSGRRGLWTALTRGRPCDLPDLLTVTGLLLAGDLAVGLGGALCGAGALPGYPLADLALLARWQRQMEPS